MSKNNSKNPYKIQAQWTLYSVLASSSSSYRSGAVVDRQLKRYKGMGKHVSNRTEKLPKQLTS